MPKGKEIWEYLKQSLNNWKFGTRRVFSCASSSVHFLYSTMLDVGWKEIVPQLRGVFSPKTNPQPPQLWKVVFQEGFVPEELSQLETIQMVRGKIPSEPFKCRVAECVKLRKW